LGRVSPDQELLEQFVLVHNAYICGLMMKKKLLVFLLTTILLNGMLLFFIGSLGEYGAKMHYALSKNLTEKEVTFQFTPAALKTYLRNKNELYFNNQMYDLVAIVQGQQYAEVTCLVDNDETFFVNLLDSNTSAIEHMKSPKQIIHLLQYLTLVSCQQQQAFQLYLSKQEQSLTDYIIIPINYSVELLTPPPQA